MRPNIIVLSTTSLTCLLSYSYLPAGFADRSFLADKEGCEILNWPFLEPVREVKRVNVRDGKTVGFALNSLFALIANRAEGSESFLSGQLFSQSPRRFSLLSQIYNLPFVLL